MKAGVLAAALCLIGGADLGVPTLAAFCSALLNRPLKDGLAVIGGLNLGGWIETVHNALDLSNWRWRRVVPRPC